MAVLSYELWIITFYSQLFNCSQLSTVSVNKVEKKLIGFNDLFIHINVVNILSIHHICLKASHTTLIFLLKSP